MLPALQENANPAQLQWPSSTAALHRRLHCSHLVLCNPAQLHGPNLQPFDYNDRAAMLHALDDAVAAIHLTNIELLAVDELLPASGPASESLASLLSGGGYGAGPAAQALPPALLPSSSVTTSQTSGRPTRSMR